MSGTDICFPILIDDSISITNELSIRVRNFIEQLFLNKKRFGDKAFERDEKLPFLVYTALRWNNPYKMVCVKRRGRSQKVKERISGILEELKESDLAIGGGIKISKPTPIESCDIERRKKRKGAVIWTKSLIHNGPYFPDIYNPYQSKDLSIIYNNKEYKLTVGEERVAIMFAQRIITEETSTSKFLDDEVFLNNYWGDFKKFLSTEHKKIFKDFRLFNFTPLVTHLKRKKELKLQLKEATKEEKKLAKGESKDEWLRLIRLEDDEKREKLELKINYGIVYRDGKKIPLRGYAVEPSGLFMGRGKNPQRGKIKPIIYPEDVTVNCSSGDGDCPEPPEGYEWGNTISKPRVGWVSQFKGFGSKKKDIRPVENSDLLKYEIARKLNLNIKEVRKNYFSWILSSSVVDKQVGTVLYLIDHFGFRAGSKDESDEGGERSTEEFVVGATTLFVSQLQPGESLEVSLKFTGKDSILYDNTVSLEDNTDWGEDNVPEEYKNIGEYVYENIVAFRDGKSDNSKIFDKISSDTVNSYLKTIDRDFTSKHFRTRLASSTVYNGLKKIKKYGEDTGIIEKLEDLKLVIRDVARLLNHKKGITDKMLEKLEENRNALKEFEEKGVSSKDPKIIKLREKIKDVGLSLDTSKKNYIDPRVVKSWSEKVEFDLSKFYSDTLRKHFEWALEDDNVDQDWDYLSSPFECVGEELEPSKQSKEVSHPPPLPPRVLAKSERKKSEVSDEVIIMKPKVKEESVLDIGEELDIRKELILTKKKGIKLIHYSNKMKEKIPTAIRSVPFFVNNDGNIISNLDQNLFVKFADQLLDNKFIDGVEIIGDNSDYNIRSLINRYK